MVNTTRRGLLKLVGVGALAGVAGCNARSSESGVPFEAETAASSDATASADSPYTRVYRQAIDSVVLVRTDDGQGTGFVFDDDHLATNAHVVGGASTVDVRFTEGEWASGDVVGTDAHSDLAAVAVDDMPSDATPLPFAASPATVGQEVVAIGNPFALDGTVTTGVVSGVDRSIPAPTGFRIPDAIQTDAAVNPGNSGGPLMSLDGRVVAVINSGGGDNIAFGISAALARRVLPELVETGTYEHSFMGVAVTDVTPAIARANGMDEPRGLLVVSVVSGGPAAGTLEGSDGERTVDGQRVPVGGDVLLSIEGTPLRTGEDLGSYLALHTRPGDTVELTVLRGGRELTVEMELGSRPE